MANDIQNETINVHAPLPWTLHNTGGKIGIKDATGKFVIRKVTNMLSMGQYAALRCNLEFIVASVNLDWHTFEEDK